MMEVTVVPLLALKIKGDTTQRMWAASFVSTLHEART